MVIHNNNYYHFYKCAIIRCRELLGSDNLLFIVILIFLEKLSGLMVGLDVIQSLSLLISNEKNEAVLKMALQALHVIIETGKNNNWKLY